VLAADTRKRLRTAPLDSPEADRLLGHLSDDVRQGSFHLAVEERVWSGGDAVGPLLELLEPIRPVGRWIRRSPRARTIAAAAYDTVSRHRHRIGRILPRTGPPPR
jgi:predicted DCC family thiol-disulfide oxidoreductase YuxK